MHETIYVTRPFLPDKKIFLQYIDQIWESRHLTNQGRLHNEFSDRLGDIFDGHSVSLTSNGHLALDVAIKGLELNGEIITTPFTFASTTHVIVTNNITPVFCDIRDDDLTIDPDLIEGLITEKTTAIMPVHVYGHLCDTEKIEAIALKYGLKVIYDAAHAFGIKKDGLPAACHGDVSMLSFHATKLFHSIEGGALVYKDNDMKKVYDAYKNFGYTENEAIEYVGLNAKMNEFQAAMGLSILPCLDDIIAERKAIALRYRENLDGIKGIRYFTPDFDAKVSHNYAYMPILIDGDAYGTSRDSLFEELKANNIYARRYFYPLTTNYECYRSFDFHADLPLANRLAERVLCLPIYNGLGVDVVDRICAVVKKSCSSL